MTDEHRRPRRRPDPREPDGRPASEVEAIQGDGEPEVEPGIHESHHGERTRAEEMGIPPLWAVGGSTAKSRELKKELAAAEEALEAARTRERDAREGYLRLAAELDNMKRRHQKDREDQLLYGNADLIMRILPLLDNFHRALEHAPDAAEQNPEAKAWINGLLMVVRQFEDILEGAGVEPIESVGQKFDPAVHQAVIAEPSDEHEEGDVIEELQKGYRLRDRVLRPSMVKVAAGS